MVILLATVEGSLQV